MAAAAVLWAARTVAAAWVAGLVAWLAGAPTARQAVMIRKTPRQSVKDNMDFLDIKQLLVGRSGSPIGALLSVTAGKICGFVISLD